MKNSELIIIFNYTNFNIRSLRGFVSDNGQNLVFTGPTFPQNEKLIYFDDDLLVYHDTEAVLSNFVGE